MTATSALGWLQRAWEDPAQALRRQPGCEGKRPPPHVRLVRALAQQAAGQASLGGSDIAALVRAVLRYETVALGHAFSMTVPGNVFASVRDEDWEGASVDGTTQPNDTLRLSARRWEPEWAGDSNHAPDDPLHAQTPRRVDESTPADPALEVIMGYHAYRSKAQREAVRTWICSPPGSTTVVNIPTGAGKTLCAFLPALAHLPDGSGLLGVTPIVVPTVALALDLEQRLSEFVGHPVAYRPESKRQASEMRDRVRQGIQGPVLVSPESVCRTLRPALVAAAKKHYLRALVVDEAHIVKAWGDEFRPAFAQISGLRREFLRETKGALKTLLMSATLTPAHLSTLQEMFGEPGPFHVVHAVRLRPEPEYWRASVGSECVRQRVVLDALRHLPRPLILYVVKRDDAARWAQTLSQHGFNRVGMMTGETALEDRQVLLGKWSADRLDIMVATSAFGLGVDKADVQAVVHACLPEGIDRLYQEVGRGGRDGFASLSLLVYHPKQDWKVAGSLLGAKYISLDRGIQRWRAMFKEKVSLGGDHYAVSETVRPSATSEDINMESMANQLWNRRTLTLMARSGLIRLDSGHGGQEITEQELLDFRGRVTVEVIDLDHLRTETWKKHIEPRRQKLIQEKKRSRGLLEDLLSDQECDARVFQRCYTDATYAVTVTRTCAGCPHCRNRKRRRVPALVPRHHPMPHFPPRPVHGELRDWLGDDDLALVWLPTRPTAVDQARLVTLIEWTQRHGNLNLVAPAALLEALKPSFQEHPHWTTFLHPGIPVDATAHQPTVFVLQDETTLLLPHVWRGIECPFARGPWIVALSQDTTQPGRDDRRIEDLLLAPPKMTLAQWSEEFDY